MSSRSEFELIAKDLSREEARIIELSKQLDWSSVKLEAEIMSKWGIVWPWAVMRKEIALTSSSQHLVAKCRHGGVKANPRDHKCQLWSDFWRLVGYSDRQLRERSYQVAVSSDGHLVLRLLPSSMLKQLNPGRRIQNFVRRNYCSMGYSQLRELLSYLREVDATSFEIK